LIRSSSLKLQGVPENSSVSGTRFFNSLKKTAFSGHEAASVYLGLTVLCAFYRSGQFRKRRVE